MRTWTFFNFLAFSVKIFDIRPLFNIKCTTFIGFRVHSASCTMNTRKKFHASVCVTLHLISPSILLPAVELHYIVNASAMCIVQNDKTWWRFLILSCGVWPAVSIKTKKCLVTRGHAESYVWGWSEKQGNWRRVALCSSSYGKSCVSTNKQHPLLTFDSFVMCKMLKTFWQPIRKFDSLYQPRVSFSLLSLGLNFFSYEASILKNIRGTVIIFKILIFLSHFVWRGPWV